MRAIAAADLALIKANAGEARQGRASKTCADSTVTSYRAQGRDDKCS